MDAPADERNGGAGDGRDPEQDIVTRAVGMLGLRIDDARSLFDEATSRWRGDALRIGEGSRQRLKDVFRELGIVTRDDWDELELRVAQLEHRIRLLEDREDRDQP